MKLVLREYDGKTFVIDEAVDTQDVERQVSVGVWPAFAIPLLADNVRIAVCVEQKSFVGRR